LSFFITTHNQLFFGEMLSASIIAAGKPLPQGRYQLAWWKALLSTGWWYTFRYRFGNIVAWPATTVWTRIQE